MRGQIETAEINYRVEADRLKVEEDRLAHLRKQVELCTIRAPQAGVVVHANKNRWWAPPLQAGNRVYQDQEMFLLPDLTQMEVQASVHESMASSAPGRDEGRRPHRVDGRPRVSRPDRGDRPSADHELEGVDRQLQAFHRAGSVRQDASPRPPVHVGLGEVLTPAEVPDALVIPVGAMSVVDGQQSCYVVGSNGLERAAITTRARRQTPGGHRGPGRGRARCVAAVDVVGIPVESRIGDPESNPATEQTASPTPMESPARSKAQAS